MKLLLKDAKSPIARILNMKIDDPRVVEYINQALEFMTVTNDWANMQRIMSFTAYNGFVSLPPEVVVPLKFTVAGRRGQPYGKHYEYVMGGPGMSENWKYTGKNLVDSGEFPTTYDITPELPSELILFSDMEETYPFSVNIRGLDETGHEVRSEDGSLGETVTWTGEVAENGTPEPQMKLTVNKFSKIIQVTKPISNGYISLNTADSEGRPEFALSHIHPYETTPSYRRFQIHGMADKDSEGWTAIKGLFRIQHTPVHHDNDPLCINMITAIKLAVKALLHYDHDEVQKAASLEGIVERMLRNQVNQNEVDDNIIDVEEGYGNGDVYL